MAAVDIPADLAYIFNNPRDHSGTHTDYHLLRVQEAVVSYDFHTRLPHNVNSFLLSKFISQHARNDIGFRDLPIKTAFLTKTDIYDMKTSVAIFNLILHFLLNKELTAEKQRILGNYIIQKALTYQIQKDEVYIQLCSQTLGKISSTDVLDRVWLLITASLGCFVPTVQLSNHLLKYVSDQAYDGYKAYCQQKLLHHLSLKYSVDRVYPPCLLEWKAAKELAAMALNVHCSDGQRQIGHVESWMSAETFAANILKQRFRVDDASGWTVCLDDESEFYECSGHDYVLDLISEIEIPQSFISGLAYFLVWRDPAKATSRREQDRGIHTAFRPRILPLEVDELREQSTLSIDGQTPVSPAVRAHPAEQPQTSVLSDSKLNNRQNVLPVDLSKSSHLNDRYLHGPSHVNAATSAPGSLQRQPKTEPAELSESKLNARYAKVKELSADKPDADAQRKKKEQSRDLGLWVTDVFDNALDDSVNQSAGSGNLVNRIKGGPDGLPVQTSISSNRLSIPVMGQTNSTYAVPNTGFPAYTGMVPMDYQQQLRQQQYLTEQASLQAQIQTQQLEKRLLQESLETEKLRKQLREVQGQSGTSSAVQVNAPASSAMSRPVVAVGHTTTAAAASSRSSVVYSSSAAQKKPSPATASKPVVKKTAGSVSADPVQTKIVEVTSFGAAAAASSSALAGHQGTSSSTVDGMVSPTSAGNFAFKSGGPATGIPLSSQNGVTNSEMPSTTSVADTVRRVRIGRVVWPPPTEENVKPAPTIGRLSILENQTDKAEIERKANLEEIQRKINERIRAGYTTPEKGPPPVAAKKAVPPKKDTTSAEMKTKQETLERQLNGPLRESQRRKDLETLPLPPLPLQPPPDAPVSQTTETTNTQSVTELKLLDTEKTVLYSQSAGPFYTYTHVPWMLQLRKEVFSADEELSDGLVDLVFSQIVQDVYYEQSPRIAPDDKLKMRNLLEQHGINSRSPLTSRVPDNIRQTIIRKAKDLPVYFTRLFPVNCGRRYSKISLVAVGHGGVGLVARETRSDGDYLDEIAHLRYDEINSLIIPQKMTLQLKTTRGLLNVYTPAAEQLRDFIDSYRQVKRHSTQSSNVARSRSSVGEPDKLTAGYSFPDFALRFFRDSPFSTSRSSQSLETSQDAGMANKWKQESASFRWTQSPIQFSLLPLDSSRLEQLAVEAFAALMQYMEDAPMPDNTDVASCILKIFTFFYNHGNLQDEIYCQVLKQITANRNIKSAQRGWRLLMLLSCFRCSQLLQPYLMNHFESVSNDQQNPYNEMAKMALRNLEQTMLYGGRVKQPSQSEIEAFIKGKNNRQMKCILAGGGTLAVDIQSRTVGSDVLDQICKVLNIKDNNEFDVFCVVTAENKRTLIEEDDYVLDLASEPHSQKQEVHLSFRRSLWINPVSWEYIDDLYLDMLYDQCIEEYCQGHFLALPANVLPSHVMQELSLVSALQAKANGVNIRTADASVLYRYLPKNIELLPITKEDWSQKIKAAEQDIQHLTDRNCKRRLLEVLSLWPRFGASFYKVKLKAENWSQQDSLLAISKNGLFFFTIDRHELKESTAFDNIITLSRTRADGAVTHLELCYYDSGHHRRSLYLETQQGADLLRTVQRYRRFVANDKPRTQDAKF